MREDFHHQRGLGAKVMLHSAGGHVRDAGHLVDGELPVTLGLQDFHGRLQEAGAGLGAFELVEVGCHAGAFNCIMFVMQFAWMRANPWPPTRQTGPVVVGDLPATAGGFQ